MCQDKNKSAGIISKSSQRALHIQNLENQLVFSVLVGREQTSPRAFAWSHIISHVINGSPGCDRRWGRLPRQWKRQQEPEQEGDSSWGHIFPIPKYMRTHGQNQTQLDEQCFTPLNCAREDLVRAEIDGCYGDCQHLLLLCLPEQLHLLHTEAMHGRKLASRSLGWWCWSSRTEGFPSLLQGQASCFGQLFLLVLRIWVCI